MRLGLGSCLALAASCGLCGCSGVPSLSNLSAVGDARVSGAVHGGQQPVSGSTIQLYAVGTTGDGSAPTPLLTPAVTTGADGSFTLTGLFTCPVSNPLVYITSSGGNPGLGAGTNNTALTLMTALGTCNSLGSSTFININEVTTVAAATAMAQFTTAPANIGSSSTDAAALTAAFNNAALYANFATGTSPGAGQSATATASTPGIPVSTIDTLANILAACVNSSGGVASDTSTNCGKLFSLTGSPTDTLSAIMALEKVPAAYNTSSLFALASATGPFQPVLATAPKGDFEVGVSSPTGGSSAVTVIPNNVYEGAAVWIVSTSPSCLYGSPSAIQMNFSSYATGGTQGCGRIYGVVPSGLPYGTVSGAVLSSSGGQTYNVSYPFYVNVVPKPDTNIAFSPTTLYWIGTAGSPGYELEADVFNHANVNLSLGTPVITGSNASAFSIDFGASSCTSTLFGGSSCRVMVLFSPAETNLVSGSLVITATDGTNHYSATAVLAGTGMN